MANNTKIEWCDHTVNLWWGCSKVHAGCKNCYAERLSARFNSGKNNVWGEKAKRKRIKSSIKNLLNYQKKAAKKNTFTKVFVGSMMDIFEDSKSILNSQHQTTQDIRHQLFNGINSGIYPNIIFLFLTKRPENIKHFIKPYSNIVNGMSNIWFGTSVSNAATCKYADKLSELENQNLFLSIEPQIQLITPNDLDLSNIDWVIQGGESGAKKRPFSIEWAYIMRDYCKAKNVPYFFKQIDKVQEIPSDLMIREFPTFELFYQQDVNF